jgi:hypothetical protein
MVDDDFERRLSQLLDLTTKNDIPNINALWEVAKDIKLIKLNIKYFGYEIAKALAASLPIPSVTYPRHVGLQCKASTQSDMESDWVAHWLKELKIPRLFHRKLWEFGYVLQSIYEAGLMHEGARGLGFGCGIEPLPSYLASKGVKVTVTDLPPDDSRVKGWVNTAQHTTFLDRAFHADLVERGAFEENVELRFVDMNNIPSDLLGFDFCWSICALEHVGSIQQGLAFIENSLDTLRPGGVSVHTTEFNFLNDEETIDNWGTVLFQKRHFSALAEKLKSQGHHVAALDFDVGRKPMDRFIDLPPWSHDATEYQRNIWSGDEQHIKLAVDGFACTCFGVIVRKAGDSDVSPTSSGP